MPDKAPLWPVEEQTREDSNCNGMDEVTAGGIEICGEPMCSKNSPSQLQQ